VPPTPPTFAWQRAADADGAVTFVLVELPHPAAHSHALATIDTAERRITRREHAQPRPYQREDDAARAATSYN